MATEIRKARRLTRFRATLAILLSTLLVVFLNLLAAHKNDRIFVKNRLSTLSRSSESILTNLQGRVEVVALSDGENSLRDSVRATLEEFSDKAKSLNEHRLRVHLLNAQGNAAEVADLMRRYNAEPNSIIVRNLDGAGHCVIPFEDLVQTAPGRPDAPEDTLFIAESRIASALWNVSRSTNPTVYFLSGFGEYDPNEYDSQSGYSAVASELRRNLYTVKNLTLTDGATIPSDCSVLVIAGSRAELPISTIERLSTYLASGGRLLLLLGGTQDAGLSRLLNRWGIVIHTPIPNQKVQKSLRVVSKTNPAVQFLRNSVPPTLGATVRLSATAASRSETSPDLPRTDVLLSTPDGKSAVAIAAERGGSLSSGGLPSPTRIIAVGDSEFAANSLAGSGYDSNRDFFLACVDWLAERELHFDRPRATFTVLRSGLSSAARWRAAIVYVILGWPLFIFLFGRILFCRRV